MLKRTSSHSLDSFLPSEKKSKNDKYGYHSRALKSIVSTYETFFGEIWQYKPTLYRNVIISSSDDDSPCPLHETFNMGWDGIINMIENSRQNFDKIKDIEPSLQPLFLQNQTPMQPSDNQSQYSFNPFAAYLDGCSIIQNHAEYFSSTIYNLCLDLQKSFPHVYCNTYLTPPNSKTVKAHADDRDVFVIQIKGRKKWKVYSHVPVPYPYSHEQVGKNGIPIPSTMTNNKNNKNNNNNDSKLLIDATLEEGDILYMPRGYVHEASTTGCENQPSFHATIAVMTSDWSYSKTIAEMVRKYLDKNDKYRMAIPLEIGMTERSIDPKIESSFRNELNDIFCDMKEFLTMESIASELSTKYQFHNHQADCIQKKFTLDENVITISHDIVGPKAAKFVRLNTRVRASTQAERESVKRGDRGLTVSENISESLLSIVARMKEKPDNSFNITELRSLVQNNTEICDFTLCSFVKCCVDLGVMTIVS